MRILGEFMRLNNFKQFSLPKDTQKREREQLNDHGEKTVLKTGLERLQGCPSV